MTLKILVDMNLSPDWVNFLGRAGIEAVHWSNVGRSDAFDSDLMHWAAESGHIVLTSDLDFSAILAATQRRLPSVVQVRSENLAPETIGDAVAAAIRQTHKELAAGAIVSLDAARARLRVLPLET